MTTTTRGLRWRLGSGDDAGIEHVDLKIAETGITAEAVVAAGPAEAPWGARWRLTVDPDWTSTRSLHLTRLGGATVALRHDGYGEWSDGGGKVRKDLAGLLDCIVLGSPFAPTQILKRLGAKASKPQNFDLVAVSLPDLDIARLSARLEPLGGGAFRLTIGETATEFAVDGEGHVTRFGSAVTRAGAVEAA